MNISRQKILLFVACCSMFAVCPFCAMDLYLWAGQMSAEEKDSIISEKTGQRSQNDPFRRPEEFVNTAINPENSSSSPQLVRDDCGDLDRSADKPRIAVIIDDMGQEKHIGDKLLALDLNLTFSFLPHAPFTRQQEIAAWSRGHDILVHMPMEPKDPQWDPGPGALYVGDTPEKLSSSVESNLARVPHAIGANNHMGSLFTEDRSSMRHFLRILGEKGMFYVDSFTTGASVGMLEAREMGIKTARRNVFLDNIRTQEGICSRLKELICIARQQGWAIGIGHANETTVMALDSCRETLLEYVTVVGVHELLE